MQDSTIEVPSTGETHAQIKSDPRSVDPGLTALVRIARFHGISANADQLRHAAALPSTAFEPSDLILAAKSLGLKARRVKVTQARLSRIPFPVLALDQSGRHFIIAGCDQKKALVMEAESSATGVLSPADVLARTNGEMVFVVSRASLAGELSRFDFSWFIPAVVKYRRLSGGQRQRIAIARALVTNPRFSTKQVQRASRLRTDPVDRAEENWGLAARRSAKPRRESPETSAAAENAAS